MKRKKKISPGELAALNKAHVGQPDPFAQQIESQHKRPQTISAREHLQHWSTFQNQQWSPSVLTSEAISLVQAQRTIWLDDAVDLMAFGLNACPLDRVELAARRSQASRALFEAARTGQVSLFGARVPEEEQAIPPSHFDIDRRLGGEVRSIELDLASASDRLFNEYGDGLRKKWSDVRMANPGEFIKWLLSAVALHQPAPVREIFKKNYDELYLEHIRGRRTTRAEDEKWGDAVGIGQVKARDIRRRLAPAEWQKSGRPRKK